MKFEDIFLGVGFCPVVLMGDIAGLEESIPFFKHQHTLLSSGFRRQIVAQKAAGAVAGPDDYDIVTHGGEGARVGLGKFELIGVLRERRMKQVRRGSFCAQSWTQDMCWNLEIRNIFN